MSGKQRLSRRIKHLRQRKPQRRRNNHLRNKATARFRCRRTSGR
jgi:hypothetical protein